MRMCTFPVIIIVFVDSFRLFFFSCGSHCWFSLNRVCVFCMCIHLFNRLRWFSLLCGCHSFFIPLILMIVCASFFSFDCLFSLVFSFIGYFKFHLIYVYEYSAQYEKKLWLFSQNNALALSFSFFFLSHFTISGAFVRSACVCSSFSFLLMPFRGCVFVNLRVL